METPVYVVPVIALIGWAWIACLRYLRAQCKFTYKVKQYEGACDVDPSYADYLGSPELAAETLLGRPSLVYSFKQTYYEPLFLTIGVAFVVAPKLFFVPLLGVLLLGFWRER